MKILSLLFILILLGSASDIDPDMHFLEVVDPDTPPRIIICSRGDFTSIEITIVYPDRPPFKINLADQRGYCGNEISDRHQDLLIYGRVVNRD